MGDMFDGYGRWKPRADPQTVLNLSWPLRDKTGNHARGINDQPPIDVTVRVELDEDGEQYLEATASRWNKSHVYVTSADPRIPREGIWLLARDVKRR